MSQPWRDGKRLEQLYQKELRSASEISERFDCDTTTITRWLERHGIEKRSTSEATSIAQLGKSAYHALSTPQYLQHAYHERSLSLNEIGEELEVSPTAIMSWMERHDIPRRSHGGRQKEKHHCWNEDLDVVCEVCGEEFHKGGESDPGRFCSVRCKAEWQSEAYKGKKNGNWSGGYRGYYGPYWPEQREKALERDDYKCQRCGMSSKDHHEEYGSELHVHHISNKNNFDSYEKMNELSNLVTLCSRCHKLLEGLPIDTGES